MARRPSVHDDSHRQDFYGHDLGLSELGYLGRDVWTRAQPDGLTEHAHRPGLELCWLERGRMDWQVAGERVALRGGDCFLAHAGEPHGGLGGVMHPGSLYWAVVDLRRLPGLERQHAAHLRRGFAGHRRFRATAELGAAFRALIGECAQRRPDAPLAIRIALHRLLLAALRAAHASAAAATAVSPPVLRALELIEESLARPPRVERLAAAVGLGPARFHERFRAEIGCAPAEHIARRRIARAQDLLRRGAAIAAIAAELGFASREHFGTAFRRIAGLPPAAWRASIL